MIDCCELVSSHLRALAPYQPGKPIAELQRELGLEQVIKLASNENPLGPSPRALALLQRNLGEVARYPDGSGYALKAALSVRFNLAPAQIVLGNGSNDVLELAARTFLGPNTSAIYARHAFAVYSLATQAAGGRGIEVPARDFGHDLERLVAAVCPDTRILFIANPNNPTGTFLPGTTILAALQQLPRHVVVVLDEAYTEYLPDELRYPALEWIKRYPNLLVVRTFSKAYGLAGLRVGFGVGHPDLIDLLNRVRQPFNVSLLALEAAVAALEDDAFLEQTRAMNAAGLSQLERGCKELGLAYIPSHGNFLAIEIGPSAPQVYQRLLELGIIVRPLTAYGLPRYLRISVGLEAENRSLLEGLALVLRQPG